MRNLAASLGRAGRADEALALLREQMPLAERALGPNHDQVLAMEFHTVLALVDRVFVPNADLIEANARIKKVLKGRRQLLGPDHPKTREAEHFAANILEGLNSR